MSDSKTTINSIVLKQIIKSSGKKAKKSIESNAYSNILEQKYATSIKNKINVVTRLALSHMKK